VLAIRATGETVDDLVRFGKSDGGRRGKGQRTKDEGEEKEGGEDAIGGLGRLEDGGEGGLGRLEDLEDLEKGGGRGTRGREGLGGGEEARLVLAIGRAKLILIGSWERTFPRGRDARGRDGDGDVSAESGHQLAKSSNGCEPAVSIELRSKGG
jgi:hypothetical protein